MFVIPCSLFDIIDLVCCIFSIAIAMIKFIIYFIFADIPILALVPKSYIPKLLIMNNEQGIKNMVTCSKKI